MKKFSNERIVSELKVETIKQKKRKAKHTFGIHPLSLFSLAYETYHLRFLPGDFLPIFFS